uniref:SAP domain-containing protein n=1 Tax=viral metagenome TaxID=1070528 RepID=A0A6C0ERU1_9ZZZZ
MNVFSKPIVDSSGMNIYYTNYFNNSIVLKNFKIPQLKLIARENNLHVSGSKPVLIERIHNHFTQSIYAITIQKMFRGHIIRKLMKLKGEALNNKKICVNETDFYTLDPLQDIPYDEFYSYKDSNNFVYGFNITSLITLFKQKGKIINPYNREKVDFKIMNDIFALYKLTKIIFPHIFNEKSDEPNIPISNNQTHQNSVVTNSHQMNENVELHNRMQAIREKPINIRIQELFMEIDLLGNYTDSNWFISLEKREYIRYYRYLYDIWHYRGQMTHETKRRICRLHDPFINTSLSSLNLPTTTTEDCRAVCLYIMENMVYTGIDAEYQKIGALHVLSVLTIVSMDARRNMMWLYESLVY